MRPLLLLSVNPTHYAHAHTSKCDVCGEPGAAASHDWRGPKRLCARCEAPPWGRCEECGEAWPLDLLCENPNRERVCARCADEYCPHCDCKRCSCPDLDIGYDLWKDEQRFYERGDF